MDETKNLRKQIFVWAAIDVDSKEYLAVRASKGREALKLTFLKEVLKYCENKPKVVNRGFWYLWTLKGPV